MSPTKRSKLDCCQRQKQGSGIVLHSIHITEFPPRAPYTKKDPQNINRSVILEKCRLRTHHSSSSKCDSRSRSGSPNLLIFIFTDPFLERLDLQREHAGIIPAEGEIAAKEPEAGMARLPPHSPQLALLVKAPDVFDAVRQRISKDLPRLRAHVLVPGREDDLVRVQLRPVPEAHGVRQDLVDLLALLDLDLAVDDELRRAHVDVIPAAALEVFHKQARAVRALVEFKPGLLQPSEQFRVVLVLRRSDGDVDALEDRVRNAVEEDVGVFDRRARLVIEACEADVEDGGRGDDAGGRALDHRHVVAVLVEILRDVVARVAAPDHQGFLAAAVGLGAFELRGVAEHVAGEGGEAFDVGREALLAGVAGCLDDVARVEGARLCLSILGTFNGDSPAACTFVPRRFRDRAGGPDIEFEEFGI